MTRTVHTPGPWEARKETDYVPAQVWADGRLLAEVYGESRAARQANAKLMAASLDLLEALKMCLTALITHDTTAEFDWHSRQIAAAEAAIAKAVTPDPVEHVKKLFGGAQ